MPLYHHARHQGSCTAPLAQQVHEAIFAANAFVLQVGKTLGMFGGTKVDAFNYWCQQVEEATSALSDAQKEALSKP